MLRKLAIVLPMVVFPALCFGLVIDPEIISLCRGDANNDTAVLPDDAVFISEWYYHGGPTPPCMNQADANDDGIVDPDDSMFILNWYFLGTAPPPPPGPFATECSAEPTLPARVDRPQRDLDPPRPS